MIYLKVINDLEKKLQGNINISNEKIDDEIIDKTINKKVKSKINKSNKDLTKLIDNKAMNSINKNVNETIDNKLEGINISNEMIDDNVTSKR